MVSTPSHRNTMEQDQMAGSLAAPSPLDIAQGPSKGLQFNQEFKPVGPGDFAGFMSGVKAAKYTHSLISGPEGMTYPYGRYEKSIGYLRVPTVSSPLCREEPELTSRSESARLSSSTTVREIRL